MKIDTDRNIGANDSFIEKRVNEVYEVLKKKEKIKEKYSRTWFDPFEKEFCDDITFKSRSTPLTITGLYLVLGNARTMLSILVFSKPKKFEDLKTVILPKSLLSTIPADSVRPESSFSPECHVTS